MYSKGHCDTGLMPIIGLTTANAAPGGQNNFMLHQVAVEVGVANNLYKQGRFNDSQRVLHQCMEVLRHYPQPDSIRQDNMAILLCNLGQVSYAQQRFDEALGFSLDALDLRKNGEDELTATLWYNFGLLLWRLDRSAGEAHYALSRSLQILVALRERCTYPERSRLDRDIVTSLSLLLIVESHRTTEAMPNQFIALIQRLTDQRACFGFEHESITATLCDLATLYMKRGRQGDATIASHFLFECLRIQRCLQASGTVLLMTLTRLGRCLHSAGQDCEAMECFREALQLKGDCISTESRQVRAIYATVLYNIGMIQSSLTSNQELRMKALHCFQMCLDLRRGALGPDHPSVGSVLHNMGILFLENSQVSKSLQCFEESLRIRRKALGPNHDEVAASLRAIAKIYQERGEYQVSLKLHAEALSILRTSARHNAPQLALEALMGLGHAQRAAGHSTLALASYKEATNILRQRRARGNQQATQYLVKTLNIMAELAEEMGDLVAARDYYAEAARLCAGAPDSSSKSALDAALDNAILPACAAAA